MSGYLAGKPAELYSPGEGKRSDALMVLFFLGFIPLLIVIAASMLQ